MTLNILQSFFVETLSTVQEVIHFPSDTTTVLTQKCVEVEGVTTV